MSADTLANRLLTRPESVVRWFLLAHFIGFSLVALLFQPTLPLDMVEQLAWARDPQWAYFKHPPLLAWILWAVMAVTGHQPWAAAITGPAASTIALWLTWRLAVRVVEPVRAAVAVLLLEGVFYFYHASLDFNHGLIQLPLWALIAYAGHRAYRQGRGADWLMLGFAAGLGMLGKYSTVLMLMALSGAFLADPQGRARLLTRGPWLAILAASVPLVPHILAFATIDFAPLRYPLERAKDAEALLDHLIFPLGWLGAQLADAALALLLAAVLLTPKRPEPALAPAAIAQSDRRYVLILALAPLALCLLIQAVEGIRFRDMWGQPMLTLIGLAIMVTATRPIPQVALARFTGLWAGMLVLAVAGAAISNEATPYLRHVGDRLHFPTKAVIAEIHKGWVTRVGDRPLDIVIGDPWPAALFSVYHPDHPSVLIAGDRQRSPWITPERLAKSGAVIVWFYRFWEDEPLATAFPGALPQPPIILPYLTGADVPPAEINWAILPPQ